MRFAALVLLTSTLALAGCRKPATSTSEPSDDAPAPSDADQAEADDALAVGESMGRELPGELVAELRLHGDGADGRLLTLAPGFIATAACSDCGAPTYLWFLAVRCRDAAHCEVLTESCEGTITREGERFELEFRPVEGATAETCAGYTGRFERP